MNQRSLGIAGICGVLALACSVQANAAKQIRTDSGNNWDSCTAGGASFPAGLLLNPFGGSDSLSFSTLPVFNTTCPKGTEVRDEDGNLVRVDYTENAGGSLQIDQVWGSRIPATSRGWENPDVRDPDFPDEIEGNPGDRYFAQVLFFDLGAAGASETVSYFDDDGLLASVPNRPGAWEIAFNYNFSNFPTLADGSEYPFEGLFASLEWNGSVYTADYDVLKDPNLYASFVYDGRDLHAPIGWATAAPPVIPVPEPNSLALLVVALASLFGVQYLRRRRSVASLTTV